MPLRVRRRGWKDHLKMRLKEVVYDAVDKSRVIQIRASCSKPTHSSVGRDSSVGIATRYGLDCPGIESRWGRDFSHPSRSALGPTQLPNTMGAGSFSGVKRPQRGVDHPHLAPTLKKG